MGGWCEGVDEAFGEAFGGVDYASTVLGVHPEVICVDVGEVVFEEYQAFLGIGNGGRFVLGDVDDAVDWWSGDFGIVHVALSFQCFGLGQWVLASEESPGQQDPLAELVMAEVGPNGQV